MKKIIVAMALMAILLTGCRATNNVVDDNNITETDRLIIKLERRSIANDYSIITDKKTGAEYLFISGVHRGVIIKLESEDGE